MRESKCWWAGAGLFVVLASGCMGAINSGTGGGSGSGGNGGTGGSAGTGGGTGGGTGSVTGLPCDVANLVATRCVSCHGASPSGGAPMSLLSAADFAKPSAVDANSSYGQRSVVRMRAASSAMPPGAPPPTAEVDAFEAWVLGGMQPGSCGEVDAGRMWPADPTCLSGLYGPMPVDGDANGGEDMAPGWACKSCHSGQDFMGQNPGGLMSRLDTIDHFMGTVFAAPHEKDLCLPSLPVTGRVEILDPVVDTVLLSIPFTSIGNFRASRPAGMPASYRARVVTVNGSRLMSSAQTSGDCNTCHTVSGAQNAPGRIYLPDY